MIAGVAIIGIQTAELGVADVVCAEVVVRTVTQCECALTSDAEVICAGVSVVAIFGNGTV